MAGLLFLAFAYFAVGQAAFTRNSAQTAADAAALAAAQDARDQLREGWLEVILDPAQWGDFLEAQDYEEPAACARAGEFAALNGADLRGRCDLLSPSGFRVTVTTTGAESRPATASAEAVIEPLCDFKQQEPTPDPSPEPTPTPTPSEEPEADPIVGLMCGGKAWVINPEDPTLPGAVELFTVRLSK